MDLDAGLYGRIIAWKLHILDRKQNICPSVVRVILTGILSNKIDLVRYPYWIGLKDFSFWVPQSQLKVITNIFWEMVAKKYVACIKSIKICNIFDIISPDYLSKIFYFRPNSLSVQNPYKSEYFFEYFSWCLRYLIKTLTCHSVENIHIIWSIIRIQIEKIYKVLFKGICLINK